MGHTNGSYRHRFLNRLLELRGPPATATSSINRQEIYDKLADIIRHNLDMSRVYEITFGRNDGRK
jgi:cobyric acid synthase